MASALRNGEQHDVVASCLSDGGVLRPVVGEVMNGLPGVGLDNSFSDATVRVVRRANKLDAGVAVKHIGVTIPAVERRVEEVCHGWVGLHTLNMNRIT
jgi:hypothetical protein